MPSEYLKQQGKGRGYNQKPFSGFFSSPFEFNPLMGALGMLGNRKRKRRGNKRGRFRNFLSQTLGGGLLGGLGLGSTGVNQGIASVTPTNPTGGYNVNTSGSNLSPLGYTKKQKIKNKNLT